ncbi:MAG: hypothetical protein HYX87_04675 [Chloroflexi bacterium]|nr:hypothetical protein [Chloroflexota bacterium]
MTTGSNWVRNKFVQSKLGPMFTVVSLAAVVTAACASAVAGTPADQPDGDTTTPIPISQPDKGQIVPDGSRPSIRAITQEESERAALAFLKASKTYTFDGLPYSVKLVSTVALKGTYRWEFVYDFESAQPGYGDRSGKMLAQVITRHRATIVTDMGVVESGVIDGQWDMVTEGPVKLAGTPASGIVGDPLIRK